jgi:hypothetical protein
LLSVLWAAQLSASHRFAGLILGNSLLAWM